MCAVAVGFTVVLFAPRFYTPQRTAALPTFKDTATREQPSTPAQAGAPEIAANPARYAGKSAEEIAKIADSICMPRVTSGPTSIAFQSERLHCLLTEGTARYCTGTQRSKITAAIIDHFRIVEHATKVAKVEVEPRILVAIEGLMRAGYLLKPHARTSPERGHARSRALCPCCGHQARFRAACAVGIALTWRRATQLIASSLGPFGGPATRRFRPCGLSARGGMPTACRLPWILKHLGTDSA